MQTGEVVDLCCFDGRLCVSPGVLFTVGKQSSTRGRGRERDMMNVIEEEGEIMKVENLSTSGGLCSLPGMCCQSE